MPSKVDDLVLRVEAVLFASGKPQSVSELTSSLGAPDFRPVQAAVKKLAKTYEARQTSLEVKRVGDRYALQLRAEFVPSAHGVTPVDLAPRTLRTLTLVAYHQPLLQSTLAKMLGEAAYEEVGRLRGLGLVRAEPKGATLELRTTKMFSEYFGITSNRPEDIRKFLQEKLGTAIAQPIPAPTETPPVSDSPAPEPEPIAPPPGALGSTPHPTPAAPG